MKLKMAPNSLFAILLRSRWWVSLLLALVAAAVARLVLPKDYEPLAVFSGLPFLVIGGVAAWKQLRQPSPSHLQETLRTLGALPWPAFADSLERAYRDEGYAVTRLAGSGADFEMTRGGRRTLVAGRRWKAARAGVEPLRELQSAMSARGVDAGIYVALGEPSDAATAFARDNGIDILRGDAIAQLMRRAAPAATRS